MLIFFDTKPCSFNSSQFNQTLTCLSSFCMLTGTASDNKVAASDISDEASSHKNTVSINQEHPSNPSPTGRHSGAAEANQSPAAPNAGRLQENPPRPELPQTSTESHKQEVDNQRQSAGHCPPQHNSASTVSSHVNTANSSSSTDRTPPSPQQNTRSPALPPHDVLPQSHGSTQQISEDDSNQKQQQQPQTTPPQSHPPSSPPQPMTQNARQHSSLLPPHPTPPNISPQRPAQNSPMQGMPQSATQGAQPVPQQPAPLTSLPPSHPTPLLPSQPSPADHGNQRPSEPTSRTDTEGTALPPQHGMVKSGPPNGIYKHQDFHQSPNHHQTQMVGSNVGMQPQRGPSPHYNPGMPPHSQGQGNGNGAMGPYSMGNPQHPHYSQTNMSRPMPPTAHHPYHNQAMNPLHNPVNHPAYHQQGGSVYSYHMPGQQQHQQPPPNMYPSHQYQQQHYYPQPHQQAPPHSQANSRGGYPPEEWHRSRYQPRPPMPPNAYLPVASARGNSQSKESSMSPLGSEGSGGAGLVSPGPVSEAGPEDGKRENRVQAGGGSPTKQAHTVSSERPESPKEILDLDSHNAAARRRSNQLPQQQQHPPPGFMYDPRAMHPGMQQGGVPPPHVMSQARGMGNGSPYPGQPYPDPGRFAAQRPHPHLMEALQRPQQLPYSPGQTRMAMYRHPRPAGHFQGMMLQQRGLAPEHFLHPG